jgi:hypothetical protein
MDLSSADRSTNLKLKIQNGIEPSRLDPSAK